MLHITFVFDCGLKLNSPLLLEFDLRFGAVCVEREERSLGKSEEYCVLHGRFFVVRQKLVYVDDEPEGTRDAAKGVLSARNLIDCGQL